MTQTGPQAGKSPQTDWRFVNHTCILGPSKTSELIFAVIHAKLLTQNQIYRYRYAHGFFILTVFSILTEIHIQK